VSAAICGASGREGGASGTAGHCRVGGGVKARGGEVFGRKQDVDASDSAKIPKITRGLRIDSIPPSGVAEQRWKLHLKRRSTAQFRREADSTIMQLNSPIGHR
jgi:hypothetical protein